jgi:hypothetical protein
MRFCDFFTSLYLGQPAFIRQHHRAGSTDSTEKTQNIKIFQLQLAAATIGDAKTTITPQLCRYRQSDYRA